MQIEVNGHPVEVPDGLNEAQISAIIKKNSLSFAKAPEPPKQSLIGDATDGAANGLYGLVKGAADPVYGLSQLGLHGVNSLYQKAVGNDLLSPVTGKNSNALQRVTDQYDNFLKNGEQQYQKDTDGSWMAGTGRVVANVAPGLASMFAKAPMVVAQAPTLLSRAAAEFPIISKVFGGAKTGAATSLAMPVYNTDGDYYGRKADQAEVGAVIGGGIPAVGAAYRGLKSAAQPVINPAASVGDNLVRGAVADPNLTTPVTQQLGANATSLGGSRSLDDILARIQNRKTLVLGSNPTTAQVVATPQIVMAEKTLSNNPAYKEALLQRDLENNAARLQAIGAIAKTPEELASLEAARKATVGPLYADAYSKTYPLDATLSSLMNRPSVEAAISRGQKLGKELGKPIGPVAGGLLEQESNHFGSVGGVQAPPISTPATIDGRTLQYLKMGLQDMQQEGARNGIGSHEQTALKGTFDTLHGWMRDNAPAYRAADEAYAKLSGPINTMRVGQAVQNTLADKSLNAGGDVGLTLNNVKSAIKSGLAEDGQYGIHPDAQTTLDGLVGDLQRRTISNSIPSAGSDSVYNLQAPNWLSKKLYGEDLGGGGLTLPAITGAIGSAGGGLLGSILGPAGAGAGATGGMTGGVKLGQKISSVVGNRVDEQLQRAMLEPDYFAQLLREGMARAGKQDGGLLTSSGSGSAGSVLGGLLGN